MENEKNNNKFFTYEELREALIAKGVDAKLLDMPAVRERLEKGRISPEDDISVNPDGTFNFGKCILEKVQIEKEIQEAVTVEDTGVPYCPEVEYVTKKVQRDVLTIVEHFEVEEKKNSALDAPFHLSEDYEPTFRHSEAQLTIVDDDGFEEERQVINNEFFVDEQLQKGNLSYRTFKERADLVSGKTIRKDGMIVETDSSGKEHKSYDNGKWNLSSGSSIGTREGDRPASAISTYDDNSKKLVSKYPHLQSATEKRRQALMHQIDERTLSLMSENFTYKNTIIKSQKLLQEALAFAQTVKRSKVGNLFFGKKAKKLLGEIDEDAKQLPEGR